MLSYLAEFQEYFGPLRLFEYPSFRAAMAAATAFSIGLGFGPCIFRKLAEFKAHQSLRSKSEVGALAKLHEGKAGTPTMGGLAIYFGLIISTLLWAHLNLYVCVALGIYTALTLLGAIDDYLTIKHKNTKGIPAKVKLAVQAFVAFVALAVLFSHPIIGAKMHELWLPFLKEPLIVAMPWWFAAVFFFFVLAGSSNAINLADGIDGLAIGCILPVAASFAIIAYLGSHGTSAAYLQLSYLPGTQEFTVLLSALAGSALAFLWFNSHPASIFMGDTGSLGIGGLIGAVAFMVHQPFTLIIAGGIFVVEALSVILQVGSFRLRGKRIFKMTPIHHHFELSGHHENKIVTRFWIVSLILAVASLITLKLR